MSRSLIMAALLLSLACAGERDAATTSDNDADRGQSPSTSERDDGGKLRLQREAMVQQQLADRGVTDQRVLQAMKSVPRHEFVPDPLRGHAYMDSPLPIGEGQTISQPYIVALMTQAARPAPDEKALDIGTGSGYQAAVLAELTGEVYSIEIVEALARSAEERLQRLGYENVQVRQGDGYRGWPAEAPFDIIIVAAAPDRVPPALVEQLREGGRIVIPVGRGYQSLLLIEKDEHGAVSQRSIAPVAFVPMTGEAEESLRNDSSP